MSLHSRCLLGTEMKVQNLRIVITGGGSGIGAALCKALSAEGHSVIICGRRAERLIEVSNANHNISYSVCNVAREQDVIAFAHFVKGRFGSVDVIINCAGGFGAIGRFDKTDSNLWRETFEVNLFGVYLVTKHLLDLLLQSRQKKIINFSGGGAFGVFPNYSAYAASKAALVRLSENMAVELAGLGVRVNCVAPGFAATEIHDATLGAGEDVAGEQYRFTVAKLKEGAVSMEVIVGCVKFLISPESGALTGKTISASFDKWNSEVFKKSIEEITDSDLFTLRRINVVNLDDKDELRSKLLTI